MAVKTAIQAPFKADHVGGLLRPESLLMARKEYKVGTITREQSISLQCGLASTHHGNKLTEEQQWEKLKYIVDISKEVWG